MTKTTAALLGISVLAVIALGIVYAARHVELAPAPIIESPVDEEHQTAVPAPAGTAAATAATTTSSVMGEWAWDRTIFISGTTNPTTGTGAAVVPTSGRFVATFGTDLSFSSTTDCNSLKGKYIVDGEVLSIGPVAGTKMACTGGSLESEYTKELGRVTSYSIDGNELHINLLRDTGTMIFTRRVKAIDPVPNVSLNGSTFRLASFNGTNTAVGSKYTLAFKDGTLSAKFCNGLGGNYTLAGGMIKAPQLVGTLMYCSDSGLMTMESTFSSIMSTGASFVQQGSNLTITGPKGEKYTYTVLMD